MKKTRVSVTMTKPYIEFLDRLVAQGLYLTRGEIILEALRAFAKDFDDALPYYKEEKQ